MQSSASLGSSSFTSASTTTRTPHATSVGKRKAEDQQPGREEAPSSGQTPSGRRVAIPNHSTPASSSSSSSSLHSLPHPPAARLSVTSTGEVMEIPSGGKKAKAQPPDGKREPRVKLEGKDLDAVEVILGMAHAWHTDAPRVQVHSVAAVDAPPSAAHPAPVDPVHCTKRTASIPRPSSPAAPAPAASNPAAGA